MTNLEVLKETESKLQTLLEPFEEIGIDSANLLTMTVTTYLPSIAKSLAVIADKISEEKKED